MTPISPAELRQARTLVAHRLALMRKLNRLTAELDHAKATLAESNDISNQRLKLRQHPERLGAARRSSGRLITTPLT